MKYKNAPLILLLAGLVTVAVVRYLAEPDLWISFWGNFLATVIALIVGVPIALWIDRRSRSEQEETLYNNERLRESRILTLVKEELNFSYESLFLAEKKGNLDNVSIQPLKSDLWDTLIQSDETKYIENEAVLNRIASAYYVLKIIRGIEEKVYAAARTATVNFTMSDGTRRNSAQILLHDARGFDELFESSVKEALKAINKRLRELAK